MDEVKFPQWPTENELNARADREAEFWTARKESQRISDRMRAARRNVAEATLAMLERDSWEIGYLCGCMKARQLATLFPGLSAEVVADMAQGEMKATWEKRDESND